MKVSELLSDASKWIKGCFAKDKNGQRRCAWESDATCFCLKGALIHCNMPGYRSLCQLIKDKKLRQKEGVDCPIVAFNDHPDTTYEEVMALLKEANL